VTGGRLSELLGLTWGDVNLADPSDASIRIESQVDRKGRRRPLKTAESQREVELPRTLATLLLALKVRSIHSRPDSFVFATLHGYRHAAVSWALAQGESVEELSWQLGHRNSAVTRVVYSQEIKSAERTARRRARMEAQYDELLGGSAVEAPLTGFPVFVGLSHPARESNAHLSPRRGVPNGFRSSGMRHMHRSRARRHPNHCEHPARPASTSNRHLAHLF
jgi:hypothetical protein